MVVVDGTGVVVAVGALVVVVVAVVLVAIIVTTTVSLRYSFRGVMNEMFTLYVPARD